MKNKERKQKLAVYGGLYHKHYFETAKGSYGCYYCGDVNSQIDHCPPLAWIDSRRTEDWARDGIPLLLVPSCADCNKLLSDRALFTLAERVSLLETKLLNRFDRESNLWSEEEIFEMSSMFQKTIRARKTKQEKLLERIRHIQWRAMQPDIWEVYRIAAE